MVQVVPKGPRYPRSTKIDRGFRRTNRQINKQTDRHISTISQPGLGDGPNENIFPSTHRAQICFVIGLVIKRGNAVFLLHLKANFLIHQTYNQYSVPFKVSFQLSKMPMKFAYCSKLLEKNICQHMNYYTIMTITQIDIFC